MTVSVTGQTPKPVTAYHLPDGGIVLTVGNESTVLDEKGADKIGRYLLFDVVKAPDLPKEE